MQLGFTNKMATCDACCLLCLGDTNVDCDFDQSKCDVADGNDGVFFS